MHTNVDPKPTAKPKPKSQRKPKATPKAKRKITSKLKARTRKAKPFNPKNLAAHLRDLLEDQYIENVLRFYPPELVAMVEAADPDLKELIRNAAASSDDIAAICALVDALPPPLDVTPDSADRKVQTGMAS